MSQQPDGNTPLTEDEREGLLPGHVTTKGELDEWEGRNVLEAAKWLAGHRKGDLLTDDFVRELHRRMFDESWAWAGQYRHSGKNIGSTDWTEIPSAVRDLCLDAKLWFDKQTYPVRQAAARLHHRVVAIHPFPNGNGRHGRMFADAVLKSRGEAPFEWGRGDPHLSGSVRSEYLRALREADRGNYDTLFKFLACD